MDVSSYVAALYHGLLGRAPDIAGLQHFTAVAQQDGLSEVVTALVGSAEYQRRQAQQTRPMPIERERPVSGFCRTSQLGDVLALEPALVLRLIPDLRGWHGSHGDYFRR